VLRVAGIVNGTTNYILSEMDSTGAEYSKALADASALGYAESRPHRRRRRGYDAAAKAAILASIAFHTRVTSDDVYREGITKITPADFVSARALGCNISCFPSASASPPTRPAAGFGRVYPALVAVHPLATVNGASRRGGRAAAAGRLMFYGQGAGGAPPPRAVTGDW